MRIAFDASKLMPPRDGIGTYTTELLRALVAVAPEHEYRLYGTLHPLAEETLEAVLPDRPATVTLAPGRGPEPGAADVFHATTWSCPPRFRGPLVFTCYDLTVLSHPGTHTVPNRVHCLEGLVRARLDDALFVTLSRAVAGELERRLGVPPACVRVIPAAVAERFRPPSATERDAVLARLGLDRPYVLAVGTREPRKNLARLADAWTGLPPALREGHELIVAGGAGWRGEELETRLDDAGARRLGRVADDDLPALYAGAAVFVYPSLAEGFGFPVLEAMACGAPVVTSADPITSRVDRSPVTPAGRSPDAATGLTPSSSLAEVAGDAALLIDPTDVGAIRDGLCRLLEDQAEADRLRAAGPERARVFSWERAARETLAVYREAAAPRP